MTAPVLHVLCVSPEPPRWGRAHGRFVVHHCQSLAEAASLLEQRLFDAMWLEVADTSGYDTLAAWPSLAHVVLDSALVITGPEPGLERLVALLQAGVQEVLPTSAVADAEGSARALRMAIERKRLERAARHAHATDLATGLPHHGQLLEHIAHLVALRAREPAPMALIALRLEGLAAAGEALGAEAMNVLRRKAAVRLRSALRASDVVASLGGDTFAVLLAWIDSPADGERVAHKLARSLALPLSVAGRDWRLQARVGLALFPDHGEQPAALLQRALAQAAQMEVGAGAAASTTQQSGRAAAANDEA